ncbi:MAG: hypothetical protein BGO49_28530 [Planctomycetales bacterium 71-10]|nr:MAG: hypothetical protein BGO49_28530 [Planctomycetales bacterium 71-10]
MVEAFPLHWPAGKSRSRNPQRSRFDVSLASARDGLLREIKLLGGKLPVVSTNIAVRRDGLPYANARMPDDEGVAVYFTLHDRQMCFACDRWDSVGDNLQAVRRTIEALRGIERWGSGDMVEQAFTGFVALPAPKSPWEVLGIAPGATEAEIDAAYRAKAKSVHPDNGGSAEAMQELNEARKRLKGGAA